MKLNEDGSRNSEKGRLVFDVERTTICGFSWYPENSPTAWYFNCAHADAANRLDGAKLLNYLLGLRLATSWLLCHNAPFELTMAKKCWKLELAQIICTMQMAVSAFGPDEYSPDSFRYLNLESFGPLMPEISRLYSPLYTGPAIKTQHLDDDAVEDAPAFKGALSHEQYKLLNKVIGKESKALHSYNGFVGQITYGYGLKQIIKSFFGYQMQTFEQTLNGKVHMGQLTGEEVADYGCDDAYWVVPLFYQLLAFMQATNPQVIKTFFEQENPIIHHFAQANMTGIVINQDAIDAAKLDERKYYATILRELRGYVKTLLVDGQWPDDATGGFHREHSLRSMTNRADWYRDENFKGRDKYRKDLISWAGFADTTDREEARRVKGSVPNGWSADEGKPVSKFGVNLTYYRCMQTLLYDLCGIVPVVGKGQKVTADSDSRELLRERVLDHPEQYREPEAVAGILECLTKMSAIETRFKLYLNPYTLLRDPETGRIYPVLSSRLATRRMAASNPNPMQLSKAGAGAYIRSFYEADTSDELIVSLDWSQIELVTIAELSGDEAFLNCYQQVPYDDLHSVAAANMIDLTLEEFKGLRHLDPTATSFKHVQFRSLKGDLMKPAAFYKETRREIGKPANFEYWYSGCLATLSRTLNWSDNEMWEQVEKYCQAFPDAEAWRVAMQDFVSQHGFVMLPDGHRRVRHEATQEWAAMWNNKWKAYGEAGVIFGGKAANAIARRARNQAVNAMIQGTNAGIAKRSIVRIVQACQREGIRARLMAPIHDEVLFSVHKADILHFLRVARAIMCHHPEIFQKVQLDATAAIGFNYQTFTQDMNPLGQFELDECPSNSFLSEDLLEKRLNEEQISEVIAFMHSQQQRNNDSNRRIYA